MKAVVSVVRNRAESGKFPTTYCKVVYQSNQFSWAHKPAKIRDKKSWTMAQEVASEDFPDTVGGALYFWNHRVHPRWTRKYSPTVITRYHTYAK